MKKILILILLGVLLLSSLYAQPHTKANFGYGSAGTIGGYPAVGGGYRAHSGHHGIDVSGRALPLPSLPAAEVRGLYLVYPKQNGLYAGVGPGYLHVPEMYAHGSLSFDAVVGYEWKTAKRRNLFVQAEAITAFKDSGPYCSRFCPAVNFGIGF